MHVKNSATSRLRRVFTEGFSAMDLAEPLVSFDSWTASEVVRKYMDCKGFDRVGLRRDGLVAGYARREDLDGGECGDHLRHFIVGDDIVPANASLMQVVESLAINSQCFVLMLDQVGGIITLSDLEKPPMRMFLFGMITLGEMLMTDLIRFRCPNGAWRELVSPQRLAKAVALQQERLRCGQEVELLNCLQYGDKGLILMHDDEVRKALGFHSRKEARRAFKELELLRNNLAHTQEIVPTGWQRIIITCHHFEQNLELATGKLGFLARPEAGSPSTPT